MSPRISLFALALVLASCGGGDDADEATASSTTTASASTSTSTSTSTVPEATTTSSTSSSTSSTSTSSSSTTLPAADALADRGARTSWSGTIGDDIEISVWLAEADGFIRGALTYDSVGEPIIVIGERLEGDFIVLREFAPDGFVTGTLAFTDAGDRNNPITGTWNDLDLELRYEGVAAEPYFFDPLVRAGSYTFQFAPFGEDLEGLDEPAWGASGALRLEVVNDRELVIAFENTRGAPGYNLATIEPTTVPLEGNRASFDSARDGGADFDGFDCAFVITVFDGFAFVRHIDDRWDCGFGNGAGVEGQYLLTDPPRFP